LRGECLPLKKKAAERKKRRGEHFGGRKHRRGTLIPPEVIYRGPFEEKFSSNFEGCPPVFFTPGVILRGALFYSTGALFIHRGAFLPRGGV